MSLVFTTCQGDADRESAMRKRALRDAERDRLRIGMAELAVQGAEEVELCGMTLRGVLATAAARDLRGDDWIDEGLLTHSQTVLLAARILTQNSISTAWRWGGILPRGQSEAALLRCTDRDVEIVSSELRLWELSAHDRMQIEADIARSDLAPVPGEDVFYPD